MTEPTNFDYRENPVLGLTANNQAFIPASTGSLTGNNHPAERVLHALDRTYGRRHHREESSNSHKKGKRWTGHLNLVYRVDAIGKTSQASAENDARSSSRASEPNSPFPRIASREIA